MTAYGTSNKVQRRSIQTCSSMAWRCHRTIRVGRDFWRLSGQPGASLSHPVFQLELQVSAALKISFMHFPKDAANSTEIGQNQ